MKQDISDRKILNWITDVSRSGCTIRDIKKINEIRKKNGQLLFALLDVDVLSADGTRLPNIVFIRGHACIIITLLKNSDTKEEKFLMIRQWRIGNGQLSLEFPAGMLDEEENPVAVAVRELHEETGLIVTEEDLFPLTDKLLFSSAGASDEGVFYYGCIKQLDDKSFCTFRDRKSGNPDEGENISVGLFSRQEAEPLLTSLQARLGFFLFENSEDRRQKSE